MLRKILLLAGLALGLAACPLIVKAQNAPIAATVVTTCGTPPSTYTAGQTRSVTQDTSGQTCTVQSGTSNPANVVIDPTSASTAAIIPVFSTTLENSHVLKNTPGNLYGFYVTAGATSGNIMLFNSATVPAAGAVTPLECVAFAANTTTGVNYIPGPMERFNTGIAAALSISSSCFTLTLPAALSYFHAMVQ